MEEPKIDDPATNVSQPVAQPVVSAPAAPQNAESTPQVAQPQSTPPTVVDTPPQPEVPTGLYSDEDDDQIQSIGAADRTVSWTTPPMLEHEKSSQWYFTLGFATLVLAGLLYLFSKSILTPIVVIIVGIIVAIYARKEPDKQSYVLNNQGVQIQSKSYPYDDFRQFILVSDLSPPEITLVPTKRFMPPLSIRYPQEDEEQIIGMLADYLPYEERSPDLLESFMRKIRF
jgi:hypothetical protein